MIIMHWWLLRDYGDYGDGRPYRLSLYQTALTPTCFNLIRPEKIRTF